MTSSLARPEGLGRKSGWLHVALYLKLCATSLQKAYAGDKVKPELLPVPVSLTRSGYPRIIPSFHRRWILRKDDRADILVQLYLSFLSLSKIIVLAKRVRKSTFTSIISPVDDIEAVTEVVSDMLGCLKDLMLRYVPRVRDIPLYHGMSLDPTGDCLTIHMASEA